MSDVYAENHQNDPAMSDAMEDEKLKAAFEDKYPMPWKRVANNTMARFLDAKGNGIAIAEIGSSGDILWSGIIDRLSRPATAGSEGDRYKEGFRLGRIEGYRAGWNEHSQLKPGTPAAAVTRIAEIKKRATEILLPDYFIGTTRRPLSGQKADDIRELCRWILWLESFAPLLSRAAPTVDEWRPIETATKSRNVGHMRMFGSGPGVHLCEFIGMWSDHFWVDAYTGRKMEPTHWQPCKSPIEAAQRKPRSGKERRVAESFYLKKQRQERDPASSCRNVFRIDRRCATPEPKVK